MDDVYALKRQGRTRTLYGVGRGCFLSLTLLLASKRTEALQNDHACVGSFQSFMSY
uniref:Uncharacterized protein n=1 Tax=Brassica campestris TaxID=3711 RepID=A0A3P6ABU0_BRACM|nr:unnamed protein product [Brassica rapa]